MEEEDRRQVWLLYGWYSGLMCLGSVFGAVTWGAWMQAIVAVFSCGTPVVTPAQFLSLNAHGQYWSAAFYVTYAMEFLCLSVAKLLVLHRMANVILTLNHLSLRPDIDPTDFAVDKGDGMSRRLAVGGRVVMAVIVVGNVTGLCGNVAAAVYAKETGDLYMAASAAYAANNTDAGETYYKLADQKTSVTNEVGSVQFFCEVAVLLIIILAFAVVGVACARRVSSALRNMNDAHGAAGRQMRRQIVGTTAFVFVTFLLRASYSTMNALATALQNQGVGCPNACDVSCYNVWELIVYWLQYTPEFQLIIVLISSPLALLVALWGMTSKRMLQQMKSRREQMVGLRNT